MITGVKNALTPPNVCLDPLTGRSLSTRRRRRITTANSRMWCAPQAVKATVAASTAVMTGKWAP
jgi:hypothetical protein